MPAGKHIGETIDYLQDIEDGGIIYLGGIAANGVIVSHDAVLEDVVDLSDWPGAVRSSELSPEKPTRIKQNSKRGSRTGRDQRLLHLAMRGTRCRGGKNSTPLLLNKIKALFNTGEKKCRGRTCKWLRHRADRVQNC